jgi:hypothetical protein
MKDLDAGQKGFRKHILRGFREADLADFEQACAFREIHKFAANQPLWDLERAAEDPNDRKESRRLSQ